MRGAKRTGVITTLLCFLFMVGMISSPAQDAKVQEGKMDQGKMEKKMEKKDKSLYQRLGGKKAITAVVDEFVGNVGVNKEINHFFAKTDLKRLKMMLVNQICQATGGPCRYKGKDMKTAHAGMGVSTADFNSLVGDLVKALDKFKVAEKEKSELLGMLGPMSKDIVAKQ